MSKATSFLFKRWEPNYESVQVSLADPEGGEAPLKLQVTIVSLEILVRTPLEKQLDQLV